MLLKIRGEITPERMKRQSQSKNNTQLWMWLVMEVKSDAVNNNIAWEPGMLGPYHFCPLLNPSLHEMFPWLTFLKRSLVFPILLFSSISLHWSLRGFLISLCYSLEFCIQMEGTNKTLYAPGPKRKELWPHKRLTQTCLWEPRSLWWRCGRQWPATWSGALSVPVHAGDLLKDTAIIFISSTIVLLQVKQQGGNTAPPINRKLD